VSVSSSLTFLAMHLLPLGALATGVTARLLVLKLATGDAADVSPHGGVPGDHRQQPPREW
jgi:hypothetical protein